MQSNELAINAIGVDISTFNALLSHAKIDHHDINDIQRHLVTITNELKGFVTTQKHSIVEFEEKLLSELQTFNERFFPTADFRYQVRQGKIDENEYGCEKETEFLRIYDDLIKTYQIRLKQQSKDSFLDKWFLQSVRDEIDFVLEMFKQVNNQNTKNILAVILSRTIRSCRATTHADLASLKEPITATYYCKKHGKICKPIFSISSWWERYSKDTLKRLLQFQELKTDTFQMCLTGDSRNINVFSELDKKYPEFGALARKTKSEVFFLARLMLD